MGLRGSVYRPFTNGLIPRSHGTMTLDSRVVGETPLQQFVGMLTYGSVSDTPTNS